MAVRRRWLWSLAIVCQLLCDNTLTLLYDLIPFHLVLYSSRWMYLIWMEAPRSQDAFQNCSCMSSVSLQGGSYWMSIVGCLVQCSGMVKTTVFKVVNAWLQILMTLVEWFPFPESQFCNCKEAGSQGALLIRLLEGLNNDSGWQVANTE